MEFGFRKNFDIQLGGLTNINVDESIRNSSIQIFSLLFKKSSLIMDTASLNIHWVIYLPRNDSDTALLTSMMVAKVWASPTRFHLL